jgi:hypothetical protein
MIITLVFEKYANFFAENCRKSQKIVIITSTPGHPAGKATEMKRQKVWQDFVLWRHTLLTFHRGQTIDILVNLDGEQNKMFGENLCAFCMAAVLSEMYFIVEP